jgi:hypothetical protein
MTRGVARYIVQVDGRYDVEACTLTDTAYLSGR